MNITADDLRAIAPKGNPTYRRSVADACNEHFPVYGINTPLRVCHFLAQAAHECDGFKTMEEYASGAAYEGRKDLGNTQPGDGKRYKGRGIFQLTGRANYVAMGRKLNLDLASHPEQASDPHVAVQIACEYWRSRNLNALADKNDLTAITKKINGGTNGLQSRRAYFNSAWRIWGDKPDMPKPAKTMATSKTAAAATAAGGLAAVQTAVQTSQTVKETVSGAGEVLGFDGSNALLIGAAVIIIGLVGFIIYERWKKLKEEGV